MVVMASAGCHQRELSVGASLTLLKSRGYKPTSSSPGLALRKHQGSPVSLLSRNSFKLYSKASHLWPGPYRRACHNPTHDNVRSLRYNLHTPRQSANAALSSRVLPHRVWKISLDSLPASGLLEKQRSFQPVSNSAEGFGESIFFSKASNRLNLT